MEQEPLVGHEFARVVDSNYQDRAKGSFGGAKSRKDIACGQKIIKNKSQHHDKAIEQDPGDDARLIMG